MCRPITIISIVLTATGTIYNTDRTVVIKKGAAYCETAPQHSKDAMGVYATKRFLRIITVKMAFAKTF